MAVFGLFYVKSMLQEAGWPRKKGLLRKEVIDTFFLDRVIDQMINWGAALGAPTIATADLAAARRSRPRPTCSVTRAAEANREQGAWVAESSRVLEVWARL